MKKLMNLLLLVMITGTCSATSKRNVKVREIYYAVNNETIDRNHIIENRFLIYDKEWKYLSGYTLINGKKDSLSSDANEYYRLSLIDKNSATVVKDSVGRILQYKESVNGQEMTHFYKYDQWGNLTEDKSVCKTDTSRINVLTYEYYYLTNFDYDRKKNGKLEIKSVDTSPWILRTVRKNGYIVQFTERKIENK